MPQAENKMDFAIQNKLIEFDSSYTVRLFFLTSEALYAEIPVYLKGSHHEELHFIFQCTLTLKLKLYTGLLHKNLEEQQKKLFNCKAHWEGEEGEEVLFFLFTITKLFPHSLYQWHFKFWYKIIYLILLIITIIFLAF